MRGGAADALSDQYGQLSTYLLAGPISHLRHGAPLPSPGAILGRRADERRGGHLDRLRCGPTAVLDEGADQGTRLNALTVASVSCW
jgi:hypothetical protein